MSKFRFITAWIVFSFVTLPSLVHGDETQEQMDVIRATGKVKIKMVRAIEIALKEAPDAKPVEAELEMEGEVPVYEIELLTAAGMKEVTLNGITGKKIKVEDEEDENEDAKERIEVEKAVAEARVSLTQALTIAAKQVKDGLVYEVELELKDGKPVIALEWLTKDKFMAMKIDAVTGKGMGSGARVVRTFRNWPFDQDPAQAMPAGWRIRQTNPSEAMATWKVTADESAPTQAHVLACTQTKNYGHTFNLAITEKTSFEDLDMTVRVKAVQGEEDQGGGPIWRCRDENNYYICRFNPLEGNYRVYFVKDSKRKQLKSIKVETQPGTWYTVRVTMIGNRITCYLDGKKMLEAEDNTFTEAGLVGLWTKADAVTSFDDLTVLSQGTNRKP